MTMEEEEDFGIRSPFRSSFFGMFTNLYRTDTALTQLMAFIAI